MMNGFGSDSPAISVMTRVFGGWNGMEIPSPPSSSNGRTSLAILAGMRVQNGCFEAVLTKL
jgi:hypothetical protein